MSAAGRRLSGVNRRVTGVSRRMSAVGRRMSGVRPRLTPVRPGPGGPARQLASYTADHAAEANRRKTSKSKQRRGGSITRLCAPSSGWSRAVKAVRVTYSLDDSADSGTLKAKRKEIAGRLRSELRLILEDPSSTLGLTPDEVRVARYLVTTSKDGRQDFVDQEEIAAAIEVEFDRAKRAVAELASRGYLERLGVAGTDAPPVSATPNLFWDFDRFVHGWDAASDARAIVEALVSTSTSGFGRLSTRKFMEQVEWTPRRINPALQLLIHTGSVKDSRTVDAELYSPSIFETDATRDFLRRDFTQRPRRA
jgi:hypothetical protein